MRKITRVFTGFLLPLALAGEVAVAGDNDTGWHSSVGVEQFDWVEYYANGTEILRESGQRLFVELSTESEYTSRLGGIYSGRFYGANVDYDGQTQSGVSATSNSLYLGL
ncbi:MAG: hypothetical protein GQ470_00590, partial [Gammaproteobacteria bacterium]|nr:hypothetical protein [Gammaproteobacteria bacterium]